MKAAVDGAIVKTGRKSRGGPAAGRLSRDTGGMLFVLPHLVLFLSFFIIPFIMGIYISFTNWDGIGKAEFVGLDNYKDILDPSLTEWGFHNDAYSAFTGGIKYTFYNVLVMVPLIVIVPLLLALMINKISKGKKLVQAILYFPSLLSVATVALTWRWVLGDGKGFVNNMFSLNLTLQRDNPWLVVWIFTLWAGVGGNLIIFLAGLSGIPRSYYEAASIDGANSFQMFFRITLPELRFQLLYSTVMGTIGAFNVYGQPAMFGVGNDRRVLMQYIYEYKTQNLLGMASALAVLLGLIIAVFSAIQFVMMRRRRA